jgi:iron complex outermembrane receptor protein
VLLLVDGHTTNDQTWGGAPMSGDLPINFSAIERIEVVRGPGSALYGTSAMFAVINIVTKTAAAIDGLTVGALVGSAGRREATIVFGRQFGSRISATASGILKRFEGDDIYYKEYDTPETNRGVAQHLDWDRAMGGLGSLAIGDATVRAGYLSRTKGVPTGSFGTAFNDPRNERFDERLWTDVSLVHEYKGRLRVSSRLYADRYRYHGSYPGDAGPEYTDAGGSSSLGGEVLGILESTSRNRLTLGTEYRHVLHANYAERFADGTYTSDDAPFDILSAFAQDEFQLSPRLTLVGGLRVERNSLHGTTTAPRVALIGTPDAASTIKLLYGEAFRAPSAAEADLTTSFYRRNPGLRPERVRTLELALTRRLGAAVLASGSIYGYAIHNLVDQVAITDDGVLEFRNTTSSAASGVELELDARPTDALQLHGAYAWQRADAEPEDTRISNSPEQIGTASVSVRAMVGVRPTVGVRYESGRRTLSGPSTPAFLRTDVTLTSSLGYAGTDVDLRVTNLFNVYYATPGGLEHLQSSIAQDGRRLSLHLSWHW